MIRFDRSLTISAHRASDQLVVDKRLILSMYCPCFYRFEKNSRQDVTKA